MIALALAGLRARRGRTLLAALGIVAASLVVGTAVTVGYGLATGFTRSADAAGLPDVIARFSPQERARIDTRVAALPNLAARSFRFELNNVALAADERQTESGALHVLLGGRHGYDVVAGRDVHGARPDVVVERGLAREWGLRPGDRLEVGDLGRLRVVGIAVSPDNVAYPLAKAARVYVDVREVARRLGFAPERAEANLALLWLHDPAKADVTLTQARAVSFGIGGLEFITRSGIRVLLDQAAGIVISLLVAFSLVALAAAGTMLAAGAHADVQRRLPSLGVQRTLGFSPGRIAGIQAMEGLVVAVPAAVLGIAVGAVAVAGPASALLASLNELAPGAALLGPLAGATAVVVAVVVGAAAWPAWRAARRPPAAILRGGDLATGRAPGRSARGGLIGLGARFATAARGRWAATVATLAVCAGVVALMLALASLLERLRDDPGTIGKRYQLLAQSDATALPAVRRIPGVAGAALRYEVDGADAFRLGESLRLVAYPGDHTRYEAPPLAAGRRMRGPGEAEVGAGLADALGLQLGSTLAVQLPNGREARFRVSGIVRALEHDGRIAWVGTDRLLDTDPGITPQIAVRLAPGANRGLVERRLRSYGAAPAPVAGATTANAGFLGVLAAVLRGVGLAVGLVCLYALVQALAVTARERRRAVALLRATGADGWSVAAVLAGAALAVALPGAVLGIVLETTVLGPLVARLAAGFADVPIGLPLGQAALVGGGLLALAAAATAVVARRVLREPVIAGLREE
jgi:ABC-type antimicrobial peptide transport system permease subunit